MVKRKGSGARNREISYMALGLLTLTLATSTKFNPKLAVFISSVRCRLIVAEIWDDPQD